MDKPTSLITIRGGIPIIFPQFADQGTGIRHGFARLLDWSPPLAEHGLSLARLSQSTETMQWWPHAFTATVEVLRMPEQPSVALQIANMESRAGRRKPNPELRPWKARPFRRSWGSGRDPGRIAARRNLAGVATPGHTRLTYLR